MDSELLNLPLGVKIPVKPRSNPVFCRGKLGEKLHGPCPYFNLEDPYIRNMGVQYNRLNDPHLKNYHKRKDILRMLKREGLITSDNKVVCTVKEFNDYRQYLTRIKRQLEQITRQQEESKETALKSGRFRRGIIALDKSQAYSRAELGTAADPQRKLNNTADGLFKAIFEQLSAAEIQKLQELIEAIVHKVFVRLNVPCDQHVNFLRNAAQGIRGRCSCMRTETPLDHLQEIEVVAKELLATVLERLGDHLESKVSKPGRAARRKEQPVDGAATRADKSKEAETASSHRACLHTCLDDLTIEVVENVHCLLKSMIASEFEGDSSCEYTESLELPKGKVSNRQMQPGFPGASKQQCQKVSMGLKLLPLGPQLQEGTGYAKTMEPEHPAMVKRSLVKERNPATSGNTLDTRTTSNQIIQSILGQICKCLPVLPPEENFQ